MVDGVIGLDPSVLTALLDYAGPIQLTTFDEQLDAYDAIRLIDALLVGTLPDPTNWRVTSVHSPPTGGWRCGPSTRRANGFSNRLGSPARSSANMTGWAR